MYEVHFGLKKNPFRMAPDTEFLFLTEMHREALVGLAYAILNRKGFTVLTGDAGTGKSTLLHRILEAVPARTSYITNPTLNPAEFLEYALLDFGIADPPRSKARRLVLLQQFLVEGHSRGEVSVLIIDEAQGLSREVLEEVRLLTNFETPEGKLLQIVLAGQNELNDLLNRHDLRQLKQRISVRLNLLPLTRRQLPNYVSHRWLKAGGGERHPFHPDALTLVADYSRGIPRTVNALCDNCLLQAFAQGASVVIAEHVFAVARDLDLSTPEDFHPIGTTENGSGEETSQSEEMPLFEESSGADGPVSDDGQERPGFFRRLRSRLF